MTLQATKELRPDGKLRLPPGQHLTTGWPVLHYGSIPRIDLESWRFHVWGLVDEEKTFTWEQFNALGSTTEVNDIHCVTTWSRLDNRWEGVLFSTLAAMAKLRPQAQHAMLHSFDGYYTNVPLSWLMQDDVLFAWSHDDKPLTEEHGGPLRLVVPKLYAWKSAKWVGGIEFMVNNKRGFWEERGYHNRGEPFAEERYSYQETEETSR